MITDETLILLALFLFIFILTLALGIESEKLGPFFLFFSGIAAIFLALESFAITASLIATTLIAAVGVFIMVAAISDFVPSRA